MTTIQVALTEGSKTPRKVTKDNMTVAIDFQQTSEKPTEQDVGTSSDALEAELPSTTGILEVKVLESRNVADWIGLLGHLIHIYICKWYLYDT